ncbi:MAG: hypothetical protein DDT32_01762 [Syntrophomonadaceae bacterium]|nr:hypothetical protein [Bacillota bacterium]MBT9147993.1 hypothetical protein [Bacillota bacterium]
MIAALRNSAYWCGVRGKHYRTMQGGYTITIPWIREHRFTHLHPVDEGIKFDFTDSGIHNTDGTTLVREVQTVVKD